MATEKEIKDLTDKIIQHGTDWLRNAKSMFDAVPYVERTLQLSQELQSTFGNCPIGIAPEKLEPIRSGLDQANSFLGSWMGGTPANTLSQAISGSAFVSAAGTQVTGLLAENTTNGNVSISSWATNYLQSLEALQADGTTQDFISRKLKTLYAGSEVEFEQSVQTFLQVKQGIGLATSAGIALRNVLESLNGNLKQLARNYSGKPNLSKWPDVAAAIARGGSTSPQSTQLVSQEATFNDLWGGNKLTKIAKNDWTPTTAEWDALFSQFLSFLYTTLALIDFKDGT